MLHIAGPLYTSEGWVLSESLEGCGLRILVFKYLCHFGGPGQTQFTSK